MSIKSLVKSIIYAALSRYIIRKGDSSYIYITFDDGPHPVNTLQLLKILDLYGVNAIFFMTGCEMEKYPDVVEKVVQSGHIVGYHSYAHVSVKRQSFSEFKDDLAMVHEFEKRHGIKIRLYRPPYGDLTFSVFLWLIFHRWKIVMWSIDSMDSYCDVDKIIQNVEPQKINNGDIILFHDDYDKNVKLFPDLLEIYKKNNIQCSTNL